jgi:hypothetical protein
MAAVEPSNEFINQRITLLVITSKIQNDSKTEIPFNDLVNKIMEAKINPLKHGIGAMYSNFGQWEYADLPKKMRKKEKKAKAVAGAGGHAKAARSKQGTGSSFDCCIEPVVDVREEGLVLDAPLDVNGYRKGKFWPTKGSAQVVGCFYPDLREARPFFNRLCAFLNDGAVAAALGYEDCTWQIRQDPKVTLANYAIGFNAETKNTVLDLDVVTQCIENTILGSTLGITDKSTDESIIKKLTTHFKGDVGEVTPDDYRPFMVDGKPAELEALAKPLQHKKMSFKIKNTKDMGSPRIGIYMSGKIAVQGPKDVKYGSDICTALIGYLTKRFDRIICDIPEPDSDSSCEEP